MRDAAPEDNYEFVQFLKESYVFLRRWFQTFEVGGGHFLSKVVTH